LKIFNPEQANCLLKHKCLIISVGLGNRNKIYFEFLEDENFWTKLKQWLAREI